MIGRAELTQVMALLSSAGNRATAALNAFGSSFQRCGKYGGNPNRPCKLLRRIKTTC